MHEIICPHCTKAFKIDEAGYADILKQVRDTDFENQLHERLELAEQEKRNAVELAMAKAAAEMQKSATTKDAEIQELRSRIDAEVDRASPKNEGSVTRYCPKSSSNERQNAGCHDKQLTRSNPTIAPKFSDR